MGPHGRGRQCLYHARSGAGGAVRADAAPKDRRNVGSEMDRSSCTSDSRRKVAPHLRLRTRSSSPIDPPARLLMGPGPINADPRVLRAMSAQLVGQYDPFMTAYDDRDAGALPRRLRAPRTSRPCWSTAPRAPASRPRSSRCIEPGDRVLVPVFGRFGHLLAEIAERCGAEVHTIEVPWGQVFTAAVIERGDRARAPAAARDRARRHLDHDGPAARGARRDLREARRAVLHRRHRLARRQRLRAPTPGASMPPPPGLQKCLGGPSGSRARSRFAERAVERDPARASASRPASATSGDAASGGPASAPTTSTSA